ncbi:MAG: long-chain fatty acid--CoA ligase [Candidatus Eiseniibacteriota bacterium]|jgi:long-chain acyl-CoA synthetase
MRIPSLNHMFLEAVDRFRKTDAFQVKQAGRYVPVSHEAFARCVEAQSLGLAELGITPGDRVALIAENRLEWAAADYAILAARAITVPAYPTLLSHQIEYILRNSGSRVAFVSTAAQLEKVERVCEGLPDLRHIVVMDDTGDLPRPTRGGQTVLAWKALQDSGAALAAGDAERFRATATRAAADDLATIIYTSGTTGIPKGVMLTHGNIAANVESVADLFGFDETDTCLSFLPLSHVFERTCGHYVMFHKGVSIAYAESLETVQQNLVEVRPTLMISVPRLYEKIHARVMTMVAASPPLRRRIFHWALDVGWRGARRRMTGRRAGGLLALRLALADRLVFAKLRARTGGRIRLFISGGAPLPAEIARFFLAAGFDIYEGYGLTETAPVLCANRPGKVKLGTVGQAVPGVELRVAEDGEVVVRGANVMRGYYRDDIATREILDEDGWLRTGDVGTIDDDGHLTITDRKKDLIVTSGGKNIAPQPVENRLKTSTLIAEAVLIGDRRKFPVVLIVPDHEQLAERARAGGITSSSISDLCAHPQILELYEREVETLTSSLSQYERPKRLALIDRPFTIESGELTPSLKVKRKVVMERFRDLIDGLYTMEPP